MNRGKDIELVIVMEKVLESVGRKAYTLADAMSDEVSDKNKALMKDVSQGYNSAEVREIARGVMSDLSDVLAGYIATPVYRGQVTGNVIDGSDDYVVRLSLPQGFQQAATDGIGIHAHLYVVYGVLAEWASEVLPQAMELCRSKQNAERAKIRSLAQGRTTIPPIRSDVM